MRHPVFTLEVEDDDTVGIFVTVRHVPGCEGDHDHTPRMFRLPYEAAIVLLTGAARLVAATGQPVPIPEETPRRPAELDDRDRKAA
jgi:hypothetical protein